MHAARDMPMVPDIGSDICSPNLLENIDLPPSKTNWQQKLRAIVDKTDT